MLLDGTQVAVRSRKYCGGEVGPHSIGCSVHTEYSKTDGVALKKDRCEAEHLLA